MYEASRYTGDVFVRDFFDRMSAEVGSSDGGIANTSGEVCVEIRAELKAYAGALLPVQDQPEEC
jgi:hypothetical protein